MTISRGSTSLLLLDLQRDFLDPDGVYACLDHIVKARPFLRTTGFRLGDPGRELIPEVGRADYELDKPDFSAFHGTPLEVLLRSLEIDTVVLTGIVTHGGVEDCVAAFDEELHLASLRGMGMYVTVMDAAAYLKALAQ